jgi:hypothetical protein
LNAQHCVYPEIKEIADVGFYGVRAPMSRVFHEQH